MTEFETQTQLTVWDMPFLVPGNIYPDDYPDIIQEDYCEKTDDDSDNESIIIKPPTIISISASKIGAALSVSPFCTRDQYKEELLAKYIEQYEYTSEEQQVIHELSNEGKKFHRIILKEIKNCRKSDEFKILAGKAIACILQTDQYKNASTQTKKKLKQALMSHYRMYFGTCNEERVANYLSQFGNIVNDNNTYTFTITTNKLGYKYICSGKIDRILEREDGTKALIEIKNRVNSFHQTVQLYEKMQIQAYLQMLDMDSAFLVECYNGEIRHHEIKRDSIYFNKTVRSGLLNFINDFHAKLEKITLKK
jgi:hypothetical protein